MPEVLDLFCDLIRAGVQLSLREDGRVSFDGPAHSLGDDVVKRLKENRDQIVVLIELFQERASIREFDGGMNRSDAEAGALSDLVAMATEYLWMVKPPF